MHRLIRPHTASEILDFPIDTLSKGVWEEMAELKRLADALAESVLGSEEVLELFAALEKMGKGA